MAFNIISFVFILNVIRTSASNVSDQMAATKVVPEEIPIAPDQFLRVIYPSDVVVDLGNELTPKQVKNEPSVKWLYRNDTFYTLLMFDADSRKNNNTLMQQFERWFVNITELKIETEADNSLFRQFLHWLVVNIPGDRIEDGETFSEYIGAFPVEGTGLHRYVFLLYQQRREMMFLEPYHNRRSLVGRSKVRVSRLVEKYHLGNPIAGNFFVAQHDSSVPEIYESITEDKTVA